MFSRATYAAKLFDAVPAVITSVCFVGVCVADTPQRVNLLSTELQQIYQHASDSTTSSATPNSAARFDSSGRLQVDVHFDCGVAAPTKQLTAAGLRISANLKVVPLCVVEGWALPVALANIAAVSNVQLVSLPSYALRRTPSTRSQSLAKTLRQSIPQTSSATAIDGNAVSIMHADAYVSQTNINGSGVTVGVISDDVTNLTIIQQRVELPAVNVVLPNTNPTLHTTITDEGTMMLEEVHAVAPGASLAFCGPDTSIEYVECLQQLAAVGATIIVDDEAYYNYDAMTSNGDFAQVVQNYLSENAAISLFTVAENYNGSYWQGAYTPVPLSSFGLPPLTCSANGQVDSYVESFDGTGVETMQVFADGTLPIWMQWADTFGQNISNFDVYVVNSNTNTVSCVPSAGFLNTYLYGTLAFSAGTYSYIIATPDQSLQGKFLKIFAGGDGDTLFSVATPGSIISPQAFVPGVLITGAVVGSDGIGNIIESYSGRGPITLEFPSPSSISAPSFVAPDAVYVDAEGTNFESELWPDGFFHGTSAAAPNAAAVAALISSAFPNLTPVQLTNALRSGAIQLGSSVPDGTYGYGRVDAIGALNTIPSPTLTGFASVAVTGPNSTPATAITITGTGKLAVTVAVSNTSLIPVSGVSVSPATCGATTLTCTVAVTPALGQSGSATVTLMVTDGANRSASVSATITVNKPTAPTVSITAGQTQTLNVGTSPSAIGFTLKGTGPLNVTASNSNATLVPSGGISINAGCGSSTLSCTATLSLASGQYGADTITISVTDPYGQAAASDASLTVTKQATPSHSGGGGGIDLDILAALAVTLGLRMSIWSRFIGHCRKKSSLTRWVKLLKINSPPYLVRDNWNLGGIRRFARASGHKKCPYAPMSTGFFGASRDSNLSNWPTELG